MSELTLANYYVKSGQEWVPPGEHELTIVGVRPFMCRKRGTPKDAPPTQRAIRILVQDIYGRKSSLTLFPHTADKSINQPDTWFMVARLARICGITQREAERYDMMGHRQLLGRSFIGTVRHNRQHNKSEVIPNTKFWRPVDVKRAKGDLPVNRPPQPFMSRDDCRETKYTWQ